MHKIESERERENKKEETVGIVLPHWMLFQTPHFLFFSLGADVGVKAFELIDASSTYHRAIFSKSRDFFKICVL
jgi:hypothetical protein